MLKELELFVRGDRWPRKPEQAGLMRARWEREKGKLKDAPAPPKGRGVVRAAAEPVAAAPEARPKRRRRTAAEVAAAEAEAQAEAALEAERELKAREALEAAKAVGDGEEPPLEERAAALFKDLPAAEEPRGEPSPFAAAPAAATPAAPPPPSAASFGAPPRAVIPTPVRPKPVASAAPGGAVPAPPRPVASAAPGLGPLEERRRDKGQKRKQGKKSRVDQEPVAQNR